MRKRKTSSDKVANKTRKASGKKVSSKKKALVYASGQECFWTSDGHVLSNLKDLSESLKVMKDEVFLHHVNKEKNDFAAWTEKVLKDSSCATSLRKAKKPKTAYLVVVKHLRSYS